MWVLCHIHIFFFCCLFFATLAWLVVFRDNNLCFLPLRVFRIFTHTRASLVQRASLLFLFIYFFYFRLSFVTLGKLVSFEVAASPQPCLCVPPKRVHVSRAFTFPFSNALEWSISNQFRTSFTVLLAVRRRLWLHISIVLLRLFDLLVRHLHCSISVSDVAVVFYFIVLFVSVFTGLNSVLYTMDCAKKALGPFRTRPRRGKSRPSQPRSVPLGRPDTWALVAGMYWTVRLLKSTPQAHTTLLHARLAYPKSVFYNGPTFYLRRRQTGRVSFPRFYVPAVSPSRGQLPLSLIHR